MASSDTSSISKIKFFFKLCIDDKYSTDKFANILEKEYLGIINTEFNGETPLSIVAFSGRFPERLDLLIKFGANVNQRLDSTGYTALNIICRWNLYSSALSLINNGADINISDFEGTSPLMNATINGRYRILSLLLEKKAAINNLDIKGFSAIDLACMFGMAECLNILIENKVNTFISSSFGMTPIHYAAVNGRIDCINILIKNGSVDINLLNNYNLTPLDVAIIYRKIDVVKFLLEQDAKCTFSIDDIILKKEKILSIKESTSELKYNVSTKSTFCYNECDKIDVKDLKICNRCKIASYCCNDCQKNHWNKHKKVCLKIPDKKRELTNKEKQLIIFLEKS